MVIPYYLDAVLSTHPDCIERGAHCRRAVIWSPITNILHREISPHITKKNPHKICMYIKGNYDAMTQDMSSFSLQFLQNSLDCNAQNQNLIKIRDALQNSIETHIPSKTSSPRKARLGWITKQVRTQLKHRDSLSKMTSKKLTIEKITNAWNPNWGLMESVVASVKWISSFLQNRKQRVQVNEEVSEWAPVEFVVSQGSVLGPAVSFVYQYYYRQHYLRDTPLRRQIQENRRWRWLFPVTARPEPPDRLGI